jgi:hypothetical protein
VRASIATLCSLTAAAVVSAAPVSADPEAPAPNPEMSGVCNQPSCTPGITGGVVLGAPCDNTTYYVFGTTSWGRLVFCGSPRRYEPRYFRSLSMFGVKELNTNCSGYESGMAQAPDGMFLMCVAQNGVAEWQQGDI